MRIPAVILFLLLLSLPLAASGFFVDYYMVRIDVDDARDMVIRENLSLEYTEPSHGFYRDIQHRFGNLDAAVDVLWTSSPVSLSDDGSFISIRFGDPDKLLSGGPYAYVIEYSYSLGADPYDDYDELYYNIVTPETWDSAIGRAAFEVNLPHPVDADRIWVTAGQYGSEMKIPFMLSDDGTVISGRYADLPHGFGITLRVEMDEGYFSSAPRASGTASVSFIATVAISLVMFLSLLLLWFAKGRDEQIIAPARFSPPDGLDPMECAYISEGTLAPRAITSMLLYWADRGFLTIDEKDDGFLITRTGDLPDDCGEPERLLFAAFFSSSSSFSSSEMGSAGFRARIQAAERSMAEHFSGDRILSSPESIRLKKRAHLLILLSVVLFSALATLQFPGFPTVFVIMPMMMAYLLLAGIAKRAERKMRLDGLNLRQMLPVLPFLAFMWFFTVTALSSFGLDGRMAGIECGVFLILLALSVFLAASLERPSGYAIRMLGQIIGYRDFICTVEKDRIERLSAEDPAFFYHVLSYAVAFGLEDRWVKAFSGLFVQPVPWYRCSTVPDIFIISSFARRCTHAASSATRPQHRSGMHTERGSSGFSGGGFSGGGGRSW